MPSLMSSLASPAPDARLGQRRRFDHEPAQARVEWVFGIGAVEAMITVGAAEHELGGVKFREFVLNGMEGEKTEKRELAHIQLLAGIGEQQPQNLRADCWKQGVQQSRSHQSRFVSRRLKAVEI